MQEQGRPQRRRFFVFRPENRGAASWPSGSSRARSKMSAPSFQAAVIDILRDRCRNGDGNVPRRFSAARRSSDWLSRAAWPPIGPSAGPWPGCAPEKALCFAVPPPGSMHRQCGDDRLGGRGTSGGQCGDDDTLGISPRARWPLAKPLWLSGRRCRQKAQDAARTPMAAT